MLYLFYECYCMKLSSQISTSFCLRIPNKRPFKNKSPFEFQFSIKKEVSGMLKEIDIHLIDLIKEVQTEDM